MTFEIPTESPTSRLLSCPVILVVEDEALIAMDIQSLLENAGYTVMGPARTTQSALSLMDGGVPDLALLDINLGNGVTAIPLADELSARGVRFIFLTGHSAHRLPDRHRERVIVNKPFLPKTLYDAVALALQKSPADHHAVR